MEYFFSTILSIVTNPVTLAIMFLANILGIIIGALPGLTATMGIALLTGLTYGLPTEVALVVLMSLYIGAIYGGSITAILLNIPGTGSAAATALDGYPLATQGRAGFAIGITRMASFFGTLFGLVMLMTIAPQLARIALLFTSAEFALLGLFGVLISGFVAGEDLKVKGWVSGFLGMLLSTIGIDELHGFMRFTFGSPLLMIGISFVPAMIGVISIPQVLDSMKLTLPPRLKTTDSMFPKWSQFLRQLPNSLRSGIIGTGVGIIPGVGEDIGSWMSYFAARGMSKKKETFGKGSVDGVVAAETGNNAAIGGALVPLLTLSIPGSPPAAVLLGALLLHGVRPGPMILFEFPGFVQEMGGIMFVASMVLFICGIFVARFFIKVLDTPPRILMPIIAVLSVMGAYAINLRIFDVYVMILLGLMFFLLLKMHYPVAPFVLGIILGPMIDANLRRTFMVHRSFVPILTRPVSLVLLVTIVLLVLFQFEAFRRLLRQRSKA